MRETAQKTKSIKSSSRSSKSVSDKGTANTRVSESSSRSRLSKATKLSKEIEEQVKVAELMAEATLLQEKQMIQNEAVVMEMKEKLAKAQARARGYTSTAVDDFHEEYQQQTLQQQKDQKQFHIKEEIDFRNKICQKTETIVPPCKNA